MFIGFIVMLLAPIIAFSGDNNLHAAGVCLVTGALAFLLGWGLDWVLDDE